jgi:hypothetical protein
MVDEPQQPVAVPSALHLVAELVPETDDVQAEVERLREELRLEREERENTVVVVASSAEPMVEENNFTKRKTMIYCGIAVFVVIGVAVGVAVGVTAANNNTTRSKPPIVSPTDEPSSSPTKPPRFNLFLEALLVQDPGLEESALTNSSTPQYETQSHTLLSFRNLIAFLHLLPPVAKSNAAKTKRSRMSPRQGCLPDILERLVLTTFYFATGGDKWRDALIRLGTATSALSNVGYY